MTTANYDYREALVDDILTYIKENEIEITPENIDDVTEELNETLFLCDSVTGSASGSYTFDAYTAEEYLCHNLGLLAEACEEFGYSVTKQIERGAETCDVLIRCYLLSPAIDVALSSILNPEQSL